MVLSDYFQGHTETIAQMMDMNVDDVDLVNDQRWASVTGFADEAGAVRPMSAAETQRFVRSTDAYYRTSGGRAESAAIKRNVTSAMGLT